MGVYERYFSLLEKQSQQGYVEHTYVYLFLVNVYRLYTWYTKSYTTWHTMVCQSVADDDTDGTGVPAGTGERL